MASAASAASSTDALHLSAPEFRKAFPKEYLLNFLQQDLRPDGRTLLEARPTSLHTGAWRNRSHSRLCPLSDLIHVLFVVNLTFNRTGTIGTADSSATAQRGGTVVTCGIKLEVSAPHALAPNDGRLGSLQLSVRHVLTCMQIASYCFEK
jgi:exosome complex RNA-binding protein Rrp42 (RNase PH superfamily)